MRLLLTLLISAVLSGLAKAQADTMTIKGMPFTVQPVHHGAAIIQWKEKTVYIDPYGGEKVYLNMPKPDLILITDVHPDHLDTTTLSQLVTSTATFVVPPAVEKLLPRKYKKQLIVLANGQSTTCAGVTIEAIPMYNLPETTDSRHPKGRGNGYVLTVNKIRIYFSGDTEDIPEMRKLKDIDIAFVCMNLPYTMDVGQAANAVLEFKPGIVYPYHYRGKDGFSDIKAFESQVRSKNQKIDVRLRDWYRK